MIARIWRGWVEAEDADSYADYMYETGIAAYRSTPGNIEARMLRRTDGDRCEFIMFTLWESMAAIERFAGDRPEQAVFYPLDDCYLIERELVANHYEVVDGGAPVTGSSIEEF